jgi:hypothetical protein
MRSQVKAGAQMAQAQATKGKPGSQMGDEDYKKLVAAIDFAFAPDRLRAAVSNRMAALLSMEDEKEVLQWLSSGLGEQFTRLEEKSGEVAEVLERQEESAKLAASVPKQRREKPERLADAIQAGEGGASMMINMTSAIVYGVALATPLADAKTSVETVRSRMEAQRSRMADMVRQSAIEGFALVYQTMSDDELEQYVTFAESPAGRRYHDATQKALEHVVVEASFEMGQRLSLRKEPKRAS